MTKKETRSTTPAHYIGPDVHKSSISIAYAAADGSDPVLYGKCTVSNLSVERGLIKLWRIQTADATEAVGWRRWDSRCA